MTAIMVRLDGGLTVPLRACDWVFYARCGCPRGVMNAVVGETALLEEETAWREFFDEGYERETAARIDLERQRGVTARLMTHAQYRAEVYPAMAAACPHGPTQMAIDLEAVDVR